MDYTGVTSFGIFNFIAAAVYVSLTGLVLAVGRAIADDVAFFQNGRLVETKDAETFWEKPECEETKEFLKG